MEFTFAAAVYQAAALRSGTDAVFVFIFRGHHKLKPHFVAALAARREFSSRFKARLVGSAVLGVQDLIYPRLRDHLARLEDRFAGIGSHARDSVAWVT
jgi:hypothetical protein